MLSAPSPPFQCHLLFKNAWPSNKEWGQEFFRLHCQSTLVTRCTVNRRYYKGTIVLSLTCGHNQQCGQSTKRFGSTSKTWSWNNSFILEILGRLTISGLGKKQRQRTNEGDTNRQYLLYTNNYCHFDLQSMFEFIPPWFSWLGAACLDQACGRAASPGGPGGPGGGGGGDGDGDGGGGEVGGTIN